MARRPSKPTPTPKKGTASWKPAGSLDLKKKDGFRMRWVNKDPMNIQRKEAEGWVPVNAETGVTTEHEQSDIESGKSLTSVTEYRELVAYCMPDETAEARNKYYQSMTDQQSSAITRNLKQNLRNADGADAEVEGNLTIINN